MKRIRVHLAISLLVLSPQLAYADSRIEKAKALFTRYVELEKEFDPSVADLYSDDAVIRNTRRYPNAQVRTIEIPADK